METAFGLDRLSGDRSLQHRFNGRIGYLCNNASVDRRLRPGVLVMRELFGDRLRALFSPQHGLFAEEQDNMLESPHFVHPEFRIPVHSLYSETRIPTSEMLEGLDTVFVDLQDVGSRPYTYLPTTMLLMEACAPPGIEVVVLDRPNPLGGMVVEGNVLDPFFRSFIGLLPIPTRHGMTMGELARMAVQVNGLDTKLQVIPMPGWQRSMTFAETGLPWVFPSPNMPGVGTAQVFPGQVWLEGTSLSEGRGTTRPFELFGHPRLKAFQWLDHLNQVFRKSGLEGFALRPTSFIPTFEKHQGVLCGGYQLHPTDLTQYQPWRVGQVLCRELYRLLGEDFQWRQPPFEYEYELLPIDILNGTDRLRRWVETDGRVEALEVLEKEGMPFFLEQREEVMLYR